MFCKNCGNEIKDGVMFCSNCGEKADLSSAQAENKSELNAGNENQTYSFKIFQRGTNSIFKMIQSLKGAYKADFTLKENRLLVIKTDNFGETVYSVPYYLIKSCDVIEKMSVGMVISFIFAGLIALALLTTDAFLAILVLLLMAAIFFIYGIKKTIFSLILNDGNTVKIKMMKIKKNKITDKQNFLNAVNARIKSAVNTGDVFETAATELTVGDIRNGVKSDEKKALVDSIINKD